MPNYIILIILFVISSCSTARDSNINDNPDLLTVTDPIKNYSLAIVARNINNEPDDLSKLLKIVRIMLDKNTGISTSKIDPNNFIKLSFISMRHEVGQNSVLLNALPKSNREIVRALHNKYMLQDPSCIFFGPTADDIIKYKFAFGCTHYARAFICIVKSLNIIKNPRDMRYVISCDSIDYNNYLLSNRKNNITINGHQFVIVKIRYKWYAINTDRSNDYVILPNNFSPDNDILHVNYPIRFKAIENHTFLLRKIAKDYNDHCNDNSFRKLMNIYISGNHLTNNANWDKYE